MQRSDAQTVPASYFRQPPAPSHLPSAPQDAAPWSLHTPAGSDTPPETGVQMPIAEGKPQLRQLPVQALSQQTPPAQKPLAHSPAAPHDWPLGFGPQLPLRQACPVTQSASVVHRSVHAPAEQR